MFVDAAPHVPAVWEDAMAFVPTPNAAKVAITGHLYGEECVNTLHFTNSAPFTGTTLATLAADVSGWWISSILTGLSAGYVMSNVTATAIDVDSGAQAINAAGSGTVGGNGAEALPNNVALCVSFRTARSGRSYRGRNYVPAIPGNQLTGTNNVKGTFATAIVTGYEILLAGFSGITWVVVSKFHNNVPRTAGVTEPIVSVLLVDTVLDSQRRRLPGRGV